MNVERDTLIDSTPRLVQGDPWLLPYKKVIDTWESQISSLREKILNGLPRGGTLSTFAMAHHFFGLFRESDGSWVFRERLPYATRVYLIGDCNAWQETVDYKLTRLESGVWEGRFPPSFLAHGQHYKLRVYWPEGGAECNGERIPPHARRVVQDEVTKIFSAQVWTPPDRYEWQNPDFKLTGSPPLIYEAHVGMSGEEGKVHSFLEFKENVLPRVVDGGYNTLQLMAIQEHPYYGSFGYQVANFFAPSSRFGTPEELKELIDAAHGMGIAVIMDLVHSHAVKNEVEGISRADGSYTLYCHGNARFEHPAWSTRLFDYGKIETLHFLLSNCRYWLEEFKFDGFRFDGVTSMLYFDHGLGRSFDNYDRYYDGNLDPDALGYLTLANELIHTIRQDAITVAEDMSGLPGLAAPRKEGGFGFDYRLAMGGPDFWIKLLKERRDEEWNVSEIFWELTNRRKDEKVIAYCESHDQALVGDKTIIFRLADKEMYWSMRRSDESIIIDRAIALHKIIRFLTLSTAGAGYLTFMGNEFGHPEWIDFPREGNNWSYHYARRQWSLVDNPELRFAELGRYDREIVQLFSTTQLLLMPEIVKLYEHIADQIIVFGRAEYIFAVNLHGTHSYPDFECECPAGEFRVVSSSDDRTFGGFDRVDTTQTYTSNGKISLYLPSRTALVLAPI